MTTPSQPLPPPQPIDYTSRDYVSIRDDLLNLRSLYMPEWSSTSPNDFGIVLLELFAYVGDTLNYYADRNAAEAFLDTATQRASILRLARLLGYTPGMYLASTTNLTFVNNTTSAFTVPGPTNGLGGTKLSSLPANSTDPVVYFETQQAVTVPANGTATIVAAEGRTISNEQIGVSDGSNNQTYPLFNPKVVQSQSTSTSAPAISVTVNTLGTPQVWSFVANLLTAGPYDQVYTVVLDENDVTSIVFGDGANGAIPPINSTLVASYRIGQGSIGNIAASGPPTAIACSMRITDNLPAGINVTANTAAIGGANAETNDSIRFNTMRASASQNRAVSLDDYASVAITVPGISKASAVSTNINSVTVYVAPDGGGGVDGSGNPVASLQNLMTQVSTTLNVAKPAPTSVTVLGPTYVPINVTITPHVLNNSRQDRAINDAIAALQGLLAFDNVIFADTLSVTDIHQALLNVQGVAWSDITVLDRGTGTGNNNSIQLAANEIPIVGTITVNATGGIS